MVARNDSYYVPWSDSTEWNDVKNKISSSEISQLCRGYETILMWKLKYNSLPAYVESTLSLLQVIIKKIKMTDVDNYSLSLLEEHELRLACSTALIRFVNHVSSIGAGKGESLYWSAKTQNIPDWVINMRHEAAHSQDLPTLDAFDAALDISFKWLLDNYWNKKQNVLKKNNFLPEIEWANSEVNLESNIRLGELFKKAFDIWDYSLRKKDFFTKEMKQEFIQHIEEFLNIKNNHFKEIKINKVLSIENLTNFSKAVENRSNEVNPSLTVRKFKSALLKLMQTMLQTKIDKQVFINSLLESSFLTESNLRFGKWQKILESIHKFNLFEALIKSLFEMAGKGHEKASKWLVILYPSIKLLRKKWMMFRTLRKENKNCDVKKLKKKIKIIHENANHQQLLNLILSKPPSINLEMMSGVLLNPETHHLNEIIQYLKFIKPPLPESTVKLINGLIHAQELAESDNENKDANDYDNNRIYTVDDLKNSSKRNSSFAFSARNNDEDGWIKCEIDAHAWSKCPLGLLPCQTRVDCNLPANLKWVIERK